MSDGAVGRYDAGPFETPLTALDDRIVAASTVDVRLQGDRDGIAVRSFTRVINQFTSALEEIDRITEPEVRRRPTWFVTNTAWRGAAGATVSLSPRVAARGSATISDPRLPASALWKGVRALATVPEIPTSFSDRVVARIQAVGAEIKKSGAGLQGVQLFAPGAGSGSDPVSLAGDVKENADRALEPASVAYSSVVGTLDVISARKHRRRVGLLIDHGPGITCDVGGLAEDTYFEAFEKRVLVEGLLRRNGRGQPVRMDAVRIELMPTSQPVRAIDLLGVLPPLPKGLTAAGYVAEHRGE